ncbi:MAG: magnesium chelatase subunit H [Gemmatirosa sp.]|nr:magnesium chelatase subunit H [Gemmatirosa sp.]
MSDTTPIRFVLVTLDAHLAGAAERAATMLGADRPRVALRLHVAADWMRDPSTIHACRADIDSADVVLVTQLFMEEQVAAIADALAARRAAGAAIVCAMCAPELMRLTRMGRFDMGDTRDAGPWSPSTLIRRLLGGKRERGTAGERQMAALRRVPKLLRFVPGPAQDVRAYYLVLQYWLAGSPENVANLVRLLVSRYAPDVGRREVAAPVEYPEVGVYHPDQPGRIATGIAGRRGDRGRVGLLVMRSYVLAGNTAHYDAVIRALEARGLDVVCAFASGLDNRPAVERFFMADGRATIDALVSLTGFSLVGGPAYSDAPAARDTLVRLDVPYLCVQALEFQSTEEWRDDARGLNALQATLQIAIPELEGATNPIVFAGKSSTAAGTRDAATMPIAERVARLADRVSRLVALRRRARAERKVAIVLFGFPPNAGNAGTAAYLDVFASLAHVLDAMRAEGYTVDAPNDAAELRRLVVEGNAERHGTLANVHARVSADAHVRREPWLAELEATWGPAPGRQLSDGASLFVLGERFGNVFVGVQPAFGYEGDPMRLLFERGFAPTHAFSAFYRWIREDFGADVVLHFGTHGALEFMPGKQTGLDATCWPDRLIGDLPNVYLYASNNPSEGTLAKRRGAATLVSYLTPPVTTAGLYRGLLDLKATLDRLGTLSEQEAGYAALLETAREQAAALELPGTSPDAMRADLRELEHALIPDGLHALGRAPSPAQRAALLAAMARDPRPEQQRPSLPELLGDASDDVARDAVRRWVVERDDTTVPNEARSLVAHLRQVDALLAEDHETAGVLRALDGRFVAPAPGGDVLRTTEVLPTGRNVYGFDPYRLPSAAAMREGRAQADRLLARHAEEHGGLPESVAMVLWGTDNMKTEGSAIAQALALLGAEPRFDGLGRLSGARLVPLAALGRPRVDVVVTLSGVFRDLFPLQIRLLAEAALLAAQADEPMDENPVRRHALASQAALGCDLETAALRVFGNAEGAYGANVNLMVDAGTWRDDAELGDAFARRKGFAYGRDAVAAAHPELFRRALASVDLSYQMVDSVELGATDVDQYVDSLGGLSRAVRSARGHAAPVYMGDATGAEGKVRTLEEQVAFESRTRLLNPRWHEGMLRSGHEGVREISTRVTTTLGWSATANATPAWVYRDVCETFVTDDAMRERLAALNPHATLRMAGRLLEASDRGYWAPDDATLDALRAASAELEDRIEGVYA